jgi:hypothetical protein
MAKLSEMILNENRRRTIGIVGSGRPSRHIKNLNLGEKILVQSGHSIYTPKQNKTEPTVEELKKKKDATEKRAATIKAKKEQEEELIKLRTEKETREKIAQEAEQKAKEAELKQKELELKEKERKAELKIKRDEAKAKEKEAYDEIVQMNKDREQKYVDATQKIKGFEKIPKQEEKKEKPRSSGLLSTATRSLRF